MMKDSNKLWEFLPDDNKLVDISRCRLPEGWLVHPAIRGGLRIFGSLVYFSDPQHKWQPQKGEGIIGARYYLQWEKFKEVPEGYGARLKVPGGWFVVVSFEPEDSTAQIVFCPDANHIWAV